MADEYISRQEAIDKVNHALDRETLLFSFVRKIVISALKRLPTADVVPVVRCRDCKYNASTHKCLNPDSFFLVPDDNDFCSYGKHREE